MSGFFVLWQSVRWPSSAAFVFAMIVTALGAQPCRSHPWQRLDRGPLVGLSGAITAIASDGERVVLIGSEKGGVSVSIDAGTSWRGMSDGLPQTGLLKFPPVTALEIAPGGTRWYVGLEGYGVWSRSPDSPWRPVLGIADTATALVFGVDRIAVLAGMFLHGVFELPLVTDLASLVQEPLGDSVMTVTGLCSAPEGVVIGTRFDGYMIRDARSGALRPWNEGLPAPPITGGRILRSSDGWYVGNALAFTQPVGGMMVRGPDDDAWREFDTGITETLSHAYDIDTAGSTFLVSAGYLNGLGVYSWTPGEPAWTEWNQGLPERTTNGMAVVRVEPDVYRVFVGTRTSGAFYRDTVLRRTSVADVRPNDDMSIRAVAVVRGALLDLSDDMNASDAVRCLDGTGRTYDGVVYHDGSCHRLRTGMLAPGLYTILSATNRRRVLVLP